MRGCKMEVSESSMGLYHSEGESDCVPKGGLRCERPAIGLQAHDGCDRLPDPLGGRFDFSVTEMGVAQCHAHIGMAE